MSVARIAICHPSDPLGNVPGGIDTFIRGVLRWAPPDIDYLLVGASSDPFARPPGTTISTEIGGRPVRVLPIVTLHAGGARQRLPLTVRYLAALRQELRRGGLADRDVLDFHRIEPVWAVRSDPRPKNLVLHQDMAVLRNPDSDIGWRHAPWLYDRLERRLLRSVERIFTVRESALQRYSSFAADATRRVEFIPTWYEPGTFAPARSDAELLADRASLRGALGVAPDAPVVVFVGRLDRQKDPLLLLEAWRVFRAARPQAQLLLIGDGVLRAAVERAAAGAGNSVRLLGVRAPEQIARILRGADAFALSSAYEGMPIAMLEALACGVPVVSTDVGEVRRVVRDGWNGALAPTREPRALAAALGRVLLRRGRRQSAACVESVRQYAPQAVLGRLYENHRRQALGRCA